MYTDPLAEITFFKSYAESAKEKVKRIEERYNLKIKKKLIFNKHKYCNYN